MGSTGAVTPRILTVDFGDSLDKISGSWDTANWLGGYGDLSKLDHLTPYGNGGIESSKVIRFEGPTMSTAAAYRSGVKATSANVA